MGFTERLPLIRKLEEIRGSRVICYLTSLRPGIPAAMEDDAVREIFDHLLAFANPPIDKLDLFLCSNGGDGTLAWKLVPVLRQYAKRFSVLIPYHAYSAATILSLGANEIVMHPFGILGPIDPTVTNEFNPQSPPGSGRLVGISVEDVKAYISFVRDTAGIKHERELAELMKVLVSQVHPLALGNVERFISQSRMIARKLLKLHMDEGVSERDVDDIIEGLASKLYFHGHPINRIEAKRELRLNVLQDVPADLEKTMWDLYLEYEAFFRNREIFNPAADLANRLPATADGVVPSPFAASLVSEATGFPVAIIESSSLSDVKMLKQRFTLIQTQPGQNQIRAEHLGTSWNRTRAPV